MHTFMAQLLANGPVVTDGAWGTQLQARGLDQGECPDLWNLSHPEIVEQVARDYVDAGSQIVLTNTFRSNRVALEGAGQSVDVVELNRVGAALSKRAADGRAAVFASIGPTGKMLLTGEIDEAALRATFEEQAAALAEGGADALVIETMGDLAETRLAVEAAKTTGIPVVACMCYDSGKDLDRTMMGVTPEQAATELEAAGADCLGANCGQGIAEYVAVCRRLAKASDLPVWIKANAGIPTVEDGQIVYHTTPDGFAEHAATLVEAGADFLGGCCGTNPQFIAALSKALGS